MFKPHIYNNFIYINYVYVPYIYIYVNLLVYYCYCHVCSPSEIVLQRCAVNLWILATTSKCDFN